MLHRCIVEGRARSILGSFEQPDFALISSVNWHLDQGPIRPGSVSKTHDFPDALDRSAPLKVVYSFGRPSDTVLSVLRKVQTDGEGWRDRHLRNMHASGAFEELPDRDILRLEEQLDAWRAVTDVPLLAIHYDALWTVRPMLDAFLGFSVPLPPQRSRGFDDLDPAIVARVRQSYARLDDKVAGLPSHWRIDG